MSYIVSSDVARQRVLEGAKILYEAVKTTMGPKGGNIVFEDELGQPNVTHDGVTVAKNVNIVDTPETAGQRLGAELVKQAANKMNDIAGDGTTTVTVLTYHILNEAHKLVEEGANPMVLKRDIESYLEEIIGMLDERKVEIEGKQAIAQVATISAGDAEIGELIASVVEQIGKEGVISVEEGGTETTSEIVEGFTFDRGWISPYMVTDSAKMEAVYENPAILVSDKSLSNVRELVPVLEKLATAGKRELLIVADNIEGEALSTLLANHIKGTFNVVAVRAPGVGDLRRDALADIAAITGATVLSPDRPTEFEQADHESIGSAKRVIVGEHTTTIIGGAGDGEAVATHIASVAARAKTTEGDEKLYLERRVAGLTGRVAVIRVGGSTEAEITEKKYRVDDAVAATKAALKEGVVSGGGVTLASIAAALSDVDDTPGSQVLMKALRKPFTILMENAGVDPAPLIGSVTSDKGYDVADPTKLIDMKKSGIIDPVVVTKRAVESAISVAGVALTTGGLIVRERKPQTSSGDPFQVIQA